MKIAAVFLAIFSVILAASLVRSFDKDIFLEFVGRPFRKVGIVAPLATNDPLRETAGLLSEKKIDIVSSPTASDSAILVTLAKDNTMVWLTSTKDISLQVNTLQIILNKLTIEGRIAKKIDLRFEDPLVVY